MTPAPDQRAVAVMWAAWGLGGLVALVVPGWAVFLVGAVLAVCCTMARPS